jgi:hypothetical protein
VFDDLDEEVDQIWAEAVEGFSEGEDLFLSGEAEKVAYAQQQAHSETDERKGLIEKYLAVPLPENWERLDIFERRLYLSDPTAVRGGELRDDVCTAEVWCECLEKEKEDMDKYKTREINDILRSLDGWESDNSTKIFELYGKQRVYTRV